MWEDCPGLRGWDTWVCPRGPKKDGLTWLAAIGELDGVIGIRDAAACGGVGSCWVGVQGGIETLKCLAACV